MSVFFEALRITLRNLRILRRGEDYFSQHKEDVTIARYLPEDSGHYLDVGCGNPIIESNTFRLYRRGWRGQMVDAWNINCRVGKIFRPRDKFYNVVMNLRGESLSFYLFDPYQYSTADRAIYEDLISRSIRFRKCIQLPGRRISDLAPAITPLCPSFLSIDIEGLDYEVLASNNWNVYLPRVICIEKISGAGNEALERDLFNRNSLSHSLLISKGYKLVGLCGPSSIYVHTSYLKVCEVQI